jgi:hypothetical protein
MRLKNIEARIDEQRPIKNNDETADKGKALYINV